MKESLTLCRGDDFRGYGFRKALFYSNCKLPNDTPGFGDCFSICNNCFNRISFCEVCTLRAILMAAAADACGHRKNLKRLGITTQDISGPP